MHPRSIRYPRSILPLLPVLSLPLLTLLSLTGPMAWAQPPAQGDEFVVHGTNSTDQSHPAIAADANGRFVITWRSLFQDGSELGIFGQRFDADGAVLGGEFQVNDLTNGSQLEPAIAMGPLGDFVISWTDIAGGGLPPRDGDSLGVFGRRFAADGSPLGLDFQIHSSVADAQERSSLAALPSGGFVATWMSRSGDGSGETVYAQSFDGFGAPDGGEVQVNTTVANGQFDPDVAAASDGRFVIAWYDYGLPSPDGSGTGVFAQRYDNTGAPVGGELQINATTAGDQFEPAVAMGPDGEFVVVWDSYFQDGDLDGVFLRRFADDGTALGSETQVNAFTTGRQHKADVAMNPDGGFVVTWQNQVGFGSDGIISDIMARTYDSNGTPTSGEFQVNTSTLPYLYFPAVASTGVDSFVVTWQGRGQGGDFDVRARRYGVVTMVDAALVGLWPFDAGSGTAAVNSADNGLDGVLEGGAGWTAGQQGSAVDLDGIDDLVRISDPGAASPIDVTDALTIAAWVRPDALDGSTQVLVSKDDAYELEVGKLGAGAWDLRLNNQVVATATTPLREGVWQHVAATWDGVEVTFYYNGSPDGSVPFGATLVPNDNDLGIGGRPSGALLGGPVFHLQGAMDEVAIYNRVLDGTEIAAQVLNTLTGTAPPQRSGAAPSSSLSAGTTTADVTLQSDEPAVCRYALSPGVRFADMSQVFTTTGGTSQSVSVAVSDDQLYTFFVRCRDGLGNTNDDDTVIRFGVGNSDLSGAVATWLLNEGNGCIAGGSQAGTLGPDCPSGAAAWTAGHDGGSGLQFDGVDDVVTVPNSPALATPAALTLSAWIRHPGNTWYRALFDARDGGSDGYDLFIDPNSRLLIRVNEHTLVGQTNLSNGDWHHVVGTYDGNTLRLYVDGTLDASTVIGASTIDVTGDLYLGRHFSSVNYTFDGALSRAALWDRALSSVEVLDLFSTTR